MRSVIDLYFVLKYRKISGYTGMYMSQNTKEKLIQTSSSSGGAAESSAAVTDDSGQSATTAASAMSSASEAVKPGPSEAYIQSKRITQQRNIFLLREGKGPEDFDFMSDDDLENPTAAGGKSGKTRPAKGVKATAASGGSNKSSRTNHGRAIGKRTTCMAGCLTSFGLAMIITSFVLVHRIEGARNAFYLFLIIGVVAIIPGSYASYNVLGNYLGWYVILHFALSYIVIGNLFLLCTIVGRDLKIASSLLMEDTHKLKSVSKLDLSDSRYLFVYLSLSCCCLIA